MGGYDSLHSCPIDSDVSWEPHLLLFFHVNIPLRSFTHFRHVLTFICYIFVEKMKLLTKEKRTQLYICECICSSEEVTDGGWRATHNPLLNKQQQRPRISEKRRRRRRPKRRHGRQEEFSGRVKWNVNQAQRLVRRTICCYLLLCHRHVLNF